MSTKVNHLIDVVSIEVGPHKLCGQHSHVVRELCSDNPCNTCCLSSMLGNKTSQIYQELIHDYKINKPSSDS